MYTILGLTVLNSPMRRNYYKINQKVRSKWLRDDLNRLRHLRTLRTLTKNRRSEDLSTPCLGQPMNRRLPLFLSISFCLSLHATATADLWLNGGIVSSVDPISGANTGEPWEYCSFDTPNSDLLFNGVTNTSISLAPGTHNFQVTDSFNNEIVATATGLGLFFTPTATRLTQASNFARLPDLNVFIKSGGGFGFAASGVSVATLGQYSGNGAYSGATSFTIGSDTVTVTGWDGKNLQLSVSSAAVPEPTTGLFAGLILCAGAVVRRCRRRQS